MHAIIGKHTGCGLPASTLLAASDTSTLCPVCKSNPIVAEHLIRGQIADLELAVYSNSHHLSWARSSGLQFWDLDPVNRLVNGQDSSTVDWSTKPAAVRYYMQQSCNQRPVLMWTSMLTIGTLLHGKPVRVSGRADVALTVVHQHTFVETSVTWAMYKCDWSSPVTQAGGLENPPEWVIMEMLRRAESTRQGRTYPDKGPAPKVRAGLEFT